MAQQNNDSKVSYFNTLIFTIVAGIISLLLLLSLFSDTVKQNAFYFIIAVEIGIFTVIGICIFQIIANEAKLRALKKQIGAKINFYDCPEYFTKEEKDGDTLCVNNYTIRDISGKKLTLRIYPVDKDMPLPSALPTSTITKNEKFSLYQIEQDPEFKTAKDQCAFVLSEPNVNSATSSAQKERLNRYVGYSKLPWMHARSRCAAYVDN